MSINTIAYGAHEDINLVIVYVNGKPVGICEEHAVDAMLFVLGYKK